MGMRLRKSIDLGGGVRINLSKSGPGVSFGTTGARTSISANGRRRQTLSIPGTGLSYVTESGPRGRRSARPTVTEDGTVHVSIAFAQLADGSTVATTSSYPGLVGQGSSQAEAQAALVAEIQPLVDQAATAARAHRESPPTGGLARGFFGSALRAASREIKRSVRGD